jgi:hypothetical protein
LRRAAEALDCTLVYALVPRSSLQDSVESRARQIATREVDRIAHTMKLEAQKAGDDDRQARIDDFVREVIRYRDLWRRRDGPFRGAVRRHALQPDERDGLLQACRSSPTRLTRQSKSACAGTARNCSPAHHD